MLRKVLVTGATGFIGKNLLEQPGKEAEFKLLNLRELPLQEINDGVFAVVHLAGKAHDLRKNSDPAAYYEVNTGLTKQVFDLFTRSNASVFIMLSSVKAVADEVPDVLTETATPAPATHYGKSKLQAETYIANHLHAAKRVYILRPCMVHGPQNKGNLNLLYQFGIKGMPWPLASFSNKRSFCSVENLIFVINELLVRPEIPSGIYNVADDQPLSTNELLDLIGQVCNRKVRKWYLPKWLVRAAAAVGDIAHLPLNTEKLNKLTENYIVSNDKLKTAIGKPLPVNAREGLIRTFKSFGSA